MSTVQGSGLWLALVGAAVCVLTPRWAPAQQMDPNMHMPMTMPMPANKPVPAKKASRRTKAATPAATPKKSSPTQRAPAKHAMEHTTHDMAMPGMQTAPVDQPAMGHDMGAMPGESMPPMDHAEKDMWMAPSAPRTPIPPLSDADRAAARPPAHDHPVHDNSIQHDTLVDRLETWNADDGTGLAWDARTWIGTDLNRVWLRSEGERIDGRIESADLEVLYGRSVAPWWDVVAGMRHDFKPGASQDFAAIGVQGVAPYKIELNATAYVGQAGQTAARIGAEYEMLLTNRLILQPRVEVNAFGRDDPRRGIGSGLGTVETGLRLRYEITRRFAPYVGVVSERAFGATARYRGAAGHDRGQTRLVAGVRFWF